MPSVGGGVVIKEGQRLRGDNEVVQQNPQFFAPTGSPHEEIDAQRHALYAVERQPLPDVMRTKILPPLRDEDAVVPCGGVIGVPVGRRIVKNDPAVAQPDVVDVVGEELTRETATSRSRRSTPGRPMAVYVRSGRDSGLRRTTRW